MSLPDASLASSATTVQLIHSIAATVVWTFLRPARHTPTSGPLHRLDPSVLPRYLHGHAFTSLNFLSQGDLPGHHTQIEPSSGIPSAIPYFIFYMTLVTSCHPLPFACGSCLSRVSPAGRGLPESWVSSVLFTQCQTPNMVPGRW